MRVLALCFCFVFGLETWAVDLVKVEKDLGTIGVLGWVHGSVSSRSLYAFTYRNPDNFFDYTVLSLYTEDPLLQKQLTGLARHDQVRLHGSFAENRSPQKHILATAVEIVQPYVNPYRPPEHHYEVEVPRDLIRLERARFLVHAIGGDGHILVVEYRDQVLPIYVRNAALSANLSRNDVVDLRFHLQKKPGQPTHLVLEEAQPDTLAIVQSVKKLHGLRADASGALVLFPKSPEIRFDVFAVTDESIAGIARQFTLVNFSDAAVFQAIRAKLQAAWHKRPKDFSNGRNKLISTCLRVRARGVFNQVDPNQANPQILLASADDLDLVDTCANDSPTVDTPTKL